MMDVRYVDEPEFLTEDELFDFATELHEALKGWSIHVAYNETQRRLEFVRD